MLSLQTPAAMANLYQTYGPPLYGDILHSIGEEGPAALILRETFIFICKHQNEYDPAKSNLFTWLLLIARKQTLLYTENQRQIADSKQTSLGETFTQSSNSAQFRIPDFFKQIVSLEQQRCLNMKHLFR